MLIEERPKETKLGTRIAYAFGTLADNLALQNFMFLGFAYYFTVAKLPVWMIFFAWALYSVWDAVDDPIIGVISDRTKTKFGRRKIYILVSAIPLCVLMVLLWGPNNFLTGTPWEIILYLLGMLILFDLFFTTYTVNFNSLWVEMFLTEKDRRSVGLWRSIFTIMGLIIAFLVPSFIIEDFTNQYEYTYTPSQYLLNGEIAAIIVLVTIVIMFIWGSFERKEFSKDAESAPSWRESYRITLKNRAFMLYAVTALAVFIVYNILPTLIPFYVESVLLGSSDDSSYIVFVGLLAGMAATPFWMWLQKKIGIRLSYMMSLSFWGVTLAVFAFIPQAGGIMLGYILTAVMGIGLGGSLYLYDQGLAVVIDDDAARSGLRTRREGAYYGVVAFFNRFSTGINLGIIAIVFQTTGWEEYTPRPGINTQLGIRALIGIWPLIVIIIALICLYFWPIHGKRYEENKRIIEEMRLDKLQI